MSKKPPDEYIYKCLKTSLKSILKLDEENRHWKFESDINDLVIKCNEIVIQTYQFIKLYIIYKYHNKEELPDIDEKFITYCIKTLGKRDNRGRKKKDYVLEKELLDFYENEFKENTNKEKFSIKRMNQIIGSYLSTQIYTCLSVNIQENFEKYIRRFVNKIGGESYKTTKSNAEKKIVLEKVKKALLSNDKEKVPEIFRKWYDVYRPKLLPESIENCVAYDIKKNPLRYLKYSLFINEKLEQKGFKMYQVFPLRTNIIPKYITLDTTSLLDYFGEKGDSMMRRKIKENEVKIWSKYFNLDKRIFKRKGYNFNFMIQTDGIAVSIVFIKKGIIKKYGNKSKKISKDDEFINIENLTNKELNLLKDKNIVGCDPGKQSLVYMVDKNGNKLRYTAPQRRRESKTKRNHKIILREKEKENIIQLETELSKHNAKTLNYEKFKKYIKEKTILNDKIKEFYNNYLFRKLKWRQKVYSQKSEDKFLNNMEKTFGKDCIIAYGNWSRETQMKGIMSTLGKGLRRIIEKRFKTFSIDEFRTSKLCCNCYNPLENFRNNKKVYRLLVCRECECSKNNNTTFFTRDCNSAHNIRMLGESWINSKERPKEFCRPMNNCLLPFL